MSEKLKVVFDTQIFLRALINPRSVCAKLSPQNWRGYYTLFVSDAVEAEIVDVLNRPEIRKKFPQITNQTVEDMLNIIHELAQRIEVPNPIEVISRDPKDDIFLACAKIAEADYLVSEDNDLLVLKQRIGTRIVNVSTFFAVLEQRQGAEKQDQ